MEAISIAPGVHWIGALDPDLRTFDIILKTDTGTSYNAYCVRGQSGVAVIDTVKLGFADEFFARLESVADYGEIRAIILNHLEPDHSGALPELLKRAPQAQIYISSRGRIMLKGVLRGEELAFNMVETGDSVDLGDRQLQFIQTPHLHWPDTQCTYLQELGILFSGDIFGCHYCDPRLFNDQVGNFQPAFEYYYANIMRPFRTSVREALAQIAPLNLQIIAPAHGPILRNQPRTYVERYDQLSTLAAVLPDAAKQMLIFYLSAYGSTKTMAERIAAGVNEAGGVAVSMHDLEQADLDDLLNRIETADCLVFGSPTINGDAVKPMWDLLSSLTTVDVKGKTAAAFGSFGWSGEAVKLLEERLRGLKLKLPVKGIRAKLIPTDSELSECQQFGRELGTHLRGEAPAPM